jgi:NAD(P)-dependent dehydrogenase (short-subunit alcohol dehydrogenase family)
MPLALITGASRGLGLALARELAGRGWDLLVDARDASRLGTAAEEMVGPGEVALIPGDVGDPDHRHELAAAVGRYGRLDLLVNNASVLGPSPQPTLDRYPLDEVERVYRINTFAPLAIVQLVLDELGATNGIVVNVTSDAAVEAYENWGGYGSSKAALDQLTAIFGAEQPAIRFYAFDPGDMRTTLQQEAFPGEDISDRAEPETVVPALLRLIAERPPSGRYRSSDLLVTAEERG